MSEQRTREYSIPKELFAPSKIKGIRVSSILLVVLEPTAMMQFTRGIFPQELFGLFILFILLNLCFMIWLVMPFNKKTNFYAVILFFTTRRHSYKSIEYQNPVLTKVDKNRNRVKY